MPISSPAAVSSVLWRGARTLKRPTPWAWLGDYYKCIIRSILKQIRTIVPSKHNCVNCVVSVGRVHSLVVKEVLLAVKSLAQCLAAILNLLVHLLQTLGRPTECFQPPHGLVSLRIKARNKQSVSCPSHKRTSSKSRTGRGWPVRLNTRFCWHQNKSSVTV